MFYIKDPTGQYSVRALDEINTPLSVTQMKRWLVAPIEDDGQGHISKLVRFRGGLTIESCSWYCMDCRLPEPNIFMAHNELWAQHVKDPDSLLCINCFQTRLGRQLTRQDLNDAPCNELFRPMDDLKPYRAPRSPKARPKTRPRVAR